MLDTIKRMFSRRQSPQRLARQPLRASYDAARDSDDFARYWANADQYDADSANRRDVREKLVPRARYEVGNNGYADGILQTLATDLVGVGPKLRMQTASQGFNQMVEMTWQRWSKAIHWRRKLWCMAHAKTQDGETFAVMRTNPGVRHPIQLDVVLYETEQCRTPWLPYAVNQGGYIDGIRFDEYGNPIWYDILQQHPGATLSAWLQAEPEQVPAEFVLHWFKLRRPGQHRAVPEITSTLNTGAAARRWREATLAAAETAADFTLLLKSAFPPLKEAPVAPMDTWDIEKRMMTTLPAGWDAAQMKAEHPTATYEAFHKQLVNEQARPKSMPYNKAACDSSSYNYASGRLDHQTYYAALDVDREDANDLVLDPLFDLWFPEAVRVFGWLGGNPDALSTEARAHQWDWPKHQAADVKQEADAIDKRLRNGSLSPSKLYSNMGEDFDDEVEQMAADYGVTTDEMRETILRNVFPSAPAAAEPAAAEVASDEEQSQDETSED